MVHILPPAGWLAGTPSNNHSKAAVVAAAPAVVAEHFTRVAEPTQTAADSFASAAVAALESGSHHASAGAGELAIDFGFKTSAANATSSSTLAGVKAAAAKLLASPTALIGGAAVGSLLVIGGLTMAVWPRDDATKSSPSPAIVANATPPETNIETPVAVVEREIEIKVEDRAAVAKPNQEQQVAANVPPTAAPSQIETTPASSTAPLAPQTPPASATTVAHVDSPRAAIADGDKGAVSPPPQVEQPAPVNSRQPSVLSLDPLDPLNFDPANLSLPSNSPNAGGNGSQSLAAAGNANANSGDALVPGAAKAAPAMGAAPAAPEEAPTITVRRGPPPAGATPTRNVASRLAVPIRAMTMPKVSLARFVEMMSDMSAVPITLDPAALEMTGASSHREIAIDAKDTTIDRLLRDVLGRQRLEIVERDGQLIIASPNSETRRARDYDVADLLNSGEADARRLAQWIQQFVAMESWEAVGGIGTVKVNGTSLRVDQSDRVHIGILIFCERLRIARGLPPKSRYPVDRLTAESPYTRLAAKLNQPTTFTFVPWTRLADVVQDWQKRSGVTMLIDWRALTEIELTPSTPVSCSAIGRTWQDAIDGILEPLGLAWWAVDGETIQITSRANADRRQRVELYAIPAKQLGQFPNVLDTLQLDLSNAAPGAVGGLSMQVDGNHLIVLGNASVHKFLSQRLSSKQ